MSPAPARPDASAGPDPARLVDWFVRPGPGRAGLLNLSYNALDRHVIRGHADDRALLDPFAPAGARTTHSYADLLEQVAQLAGGLRELGVRPGRAVLVAFPRSATQLVALLACARLGAVAVPVDVPAWTADPGLAGRALPTAPAVTLVDGVDKQALDAVLAAADRTAAFTATRAPGKGALDQTGDLDLAVLMRPGQFEPGAAAELAPDAPFLVAPGPGSPRRREQGWTLELAADEHARGTAPGELVDPADPSRPDPYAALLGPLLRGATVELR